MTEVKAIEAKGLTKRYGDFTAVDHVSFDVYKGEIFDFPAPLGPRKPKTSPLLIFRSRPSTALTSPGKTLVRPSVSIA